VLLYYSGEILQRLTVEIQKLVCERCGSTWINRVENPIKCPRCQHVFGTKINKKAMEGQPAKVEPSIAPNPTTTPFSRHGGKAFDK
jgi:hypothetical protein